MRPNLADHTDYLKAVAKGDGKVIAELESLPNSMVEITYEDGWRKIVGVGENEAKPMVRFHGDCMPVTGRWITNRVRSDLTDRDKEERQIGLPRATGWFSVRSLVDGDVVGLYMKEEEEVTDRYFANCTATYASEGGWSFDGKTYHFDILEKAIGRKALDEKEQEMKYTHGWYKLYGLNRRTNANLEKSVFGLLHDKEAVLNVAIVQHADEIKLILGDNTEELQFQLDGIMSYRKLED